MTDDFVDPGEPGELKTGLRAKNLVNQPLIIRPNAILEAMGKDDAGNDKPYTYVDCDVWVLDRQGVIDHDTGVQFSWVRVMPQLSDRLGQYVAGKPIRGSDNSITLQPFTEDGKKIARSVIAEIRNTAPATPPAEEYSDGEEPF